MTEQSEVEQTEEDRANTIIGCLYAFAIGLNVLIIADNMTDGKVGDAIPVAWRAVVKKVRKVAAPALLIREWRRHRPEVVWEAMTAVEEANGE